MNSLTIFILFGFFSPMVSGAVSGGAWSGPGAWYEKSIPRIEGNDIMMLPLVNALIPGDETFNPLYSSQSEFDRHLMGALTMGLSEKDRESFYANASEAIRTRQWEGRVPEFLRVLDGACEKAAPKVLEAVENEERVVVSKFASGKIDQQGLAQTINEFRHFSVFWPEIDEMVARLERVKNAPTLEDARHIADAILLELREVDASVAAVSKETPPIFIEPSARAVSKNDLKPAAPALSAEWDASLGNDSRIYYKLSLNGEDAGHLVLDERSKTLEIIRDHDVNIGNELIHKNAKAMQEVFRRVSVKARREEKQIKLTIRNVTELELAKNVFSNIKVLKKRDKDSRADRYNRAFIEISKNMLRGLSMEHRAADWIPLETMEEKFKGHLIAIDDKGSLPEPLDIRVGPGPQ